MTYRIGEGGKSITCLRCGMTSHNANDIAQLYCGRCHRFHDDLNWPRLSTETDESRRAGPAREMESNP
jgi:ribosomal protein S27AE